MSLVASVAEAKKIGGWKFFWASGQGFVRVPFYPDYFRTTQRRMGLLVGVSENYLLNHQGMLERGATALFLFDHHRPFLRLDEVVEFRRTAEWLPTGEGISH